ncbi:MAG: hypothetical protein II984_01185 [Clostridia bacterium]|nr:hypothetical protein [Clostridia bacterium]
MCIYKRSIDARHKDDIKFVSSVCADVEAKKSTIDDALLSKYGVKYLADDNIDITLRGEMPEKSPLIVGFGPAGMFCALLLARAGLKPIVIERGDDVDTRVDKVNNFYKNKVLDVNSNIQFGAGGAGTFSDGKLTTRINDPKCSFVLKTFAELGAPEDIIYNAKPHIGTDMLRAVVKNMSYEIEKLGGKIYYNTCLKGFDDGIAVTNNGSIEYSSIVLAIGHSARDTYDYLLKKGVAIEPKPFSVGVRVEHLRRDINEAMYGKYAEDNRLGAASYNVSYRENNRGVYSFCMCPGGEVVCAQSEENSVVVNGMSSFARDKINSNSAIAVQVDREDYGSTPYKAIEFQRDLEKKAFLAAGANYKAPVQTLGDFYENKAINEPSKIMPSYMNGYTQVSDINNILPKFVCDYLKLGFEKFGKKISGFDAKDVPITGVETRTSAPIRIMRNDKLLLLGSDNVYPCGEGAGYAGGIMSAAVDGINVALAILQR